MNPVVELTCSRGTIMPDFEFNCDDCGQLWSLRVKRKGPHYCKTCIEKRRKEGRGPVQMARAKRAGNIGDRGVIAKPTGTRMDTRLTLEEFIPHIRHWHNEYLTNNPEVPMLEQRIQEKALVDGFLDKEALKEIAIWGGNAHSRWQQMWDHNTEEEVRGFTAEAIKFLADPQMALKKITDIDQWGDSFGSKTLAFLSPSTCPVWDSVLRDCLSAATNPPRSYSDFVRVCKDITTRIPYPNSMRPRQGWLVRDVEIAMFQFGWPTNRGGHGGMITGNLPQL